MGNIMQILEQHILAKDVLNLINMRLETVNNNYLYAKGKERTVEAEAMAETKWQLAELKMQFVDYLSKQLEIALQVNVSSIDYESILRNQTI